MKTASSFGGCSTLQIKSAISASTSNVKAIIDNAFKDVMPQQVLTVTAPEQVRAALSVASKFLKERRESSQVVFLILDLFLLSSELRDLERKVMDPTAPLAWTPDIAQIRELLCSYGEVEEETPERHRRNKCLCSLRILHSLWRFIDPSVIVIFNAGSIRIAGRDVALVGARLVNEGVAWLYTKQDEDAGENFANYLRVLRERAERTLPQPDVLVSV